MNIKRTFFLATLIEVVIISGCACGKGNVKQSEKPIQVEMKPVQVQSVVVDTVEVKKKLMEAKGNIFREGWPKLAVGMSVGELTQLFGSDLGLGYCNGQPSFCTWTPKLSYYGYPDLKVDVTFKFDARKLTEWSPKELPPKE